MNCPSRRLGCNVGNASRFSTARKRTLALAATPTTAASFTPPHRKWFLVTPNLCGRLTSPQLIGLLEEEYVPHYVVIESTGVYERGGGDPRSGGAGSRLFVSPEFYFDMLWLIERETRANLAAAQGPERACPQCREVNPPNFDICWKCGANLAGDT